jgi:hypothetical protein
MRRIGPVLERRHVVDGAFYEMLILPLLLTLPIEEKSKYPRYHLSVPLQKNLDK